MVPWPRSLLAALATLMLALACLPGAVLAASLDSDGTLEAKLGLPAVRGWKLKRLPHISGCKSGSMTKTWQSPSFAPAPAASSPPSITSSRLASYEPAHRDNMGCTVCFIFS
jgi:hypothetical protein